MRRAAAMVVMGVSVMSAVAAIAQTAQTPDVIWRTDIKTSPPNHFGRHRVDFSPDGSLIGVVYQPQQARIIRASDGALVRELPAPLRHSRPTPLRSHRMGLSLSAEAPTLRAGMPPSRSSTSQRGVQNCFRARAPP